MGKVVDINRSEPHTSGAATCSSCNHKWAAVAPQGLVDLECPACSRLYGLFDAPVRPADGVVWVCACGGDLFHLVPDGALCRKCGELTKRP